MRLDFFVKVIILSVGIKYSMHKLLFELNNYACVTK